MKLNSLNIKRGIKEWNMSYMFYTFTYICMMSRSSVLSLQLVSAAREELYVGDLHNNIGLVLAYYYYIITRRMLEHCGRVGATQNIAMRLLQQRC